MILLWLIPCLIIVAVVIFLAWVLCRISAEQADDSERISTEESGRVYQAWMRRRP